MTGNHAVRGSGLCIVSTCAPLCNIAVVRAAYEVLPGNIGYPSLVSKDGDRGLPGVSSRNTMTINNTLGVG